MRYKCEYVCGETLSGTRINANLFSFSHRRPISFAAKIFFKKMLRRSVPSRVSAECVSRTQDTLLCVNRVNLNVVSPQSAVETPGHQEGTSRGIALGRMAAVIAARRSRPHFSTQDASRIAANRKRHAVRQYPCVCTRAAALPMWARNSSQHT